MLAGFYGQGRHSRAKAFEAAERALGLVGLPTDPRAPVDGLGAAALKKLELAKALATSPKLLLADESLSGLDEHEMDHAAELLRRIRQDLEHHDHLGRAHHGRPDARGGPRDGARSRREDRRGLAGAGRERSARDRGLSRHPGRGGLGGPRPPAADARAQVRLRRLRDVSGAVRRVARREGRRGGRRHRPERRRQDDADARHLRADPAHLRLDPPGGRRSGGDAVAPDRGARRRPRAGEPPPVPAHDGRGQSENGRLRAVGPAEIPPAARDRLRAVPAPPGAPSPARRQHVRRRAADVRHRPRPHVGAQAARCSTSRRPGSRRSSSSRCSTSSSASGPAA